MKRPVAPLFMLALVAAACHHASNAATQPQPPAGEAWLTDQQVKNANLVVKPVTDQDVGGAVVTSGRVTFDDLRVAHVFSPVTGRVTSIRAQPGDRVQKGAPLAGMQSPDKIEFLNAEHGEGVAVMRTLKRALDPENILNPGKVVRL